MPMAIKQLRRLNGNPAKPNNGDVPFPSPHSATHTATATAHYVLLIIRVQSCRPLDGFQRSTPTPKGLIKKQSTDIKTTQQQRVGEVEGQRELAKRSVIVLHLPHHVTSCRWQLLLSPSLSLSLSSYLCLPLSPYLYLIDAAKVKKVPLPLVS